MITVEFLISVILMLTFMKMIVLTIVPLKRFTEAAEAVQ